MGTPTTTTAEGNVPSSALAVDPNHLCNQGTIYAGTLDTGGVVMNRVDPYTKTTHVS